MTQQHKKISENKTAVTAAYDGGGINGVQLKNNREYTVAQRKLAEGSTSQEASFSPIQRKKTDDQPIQRIIVDGDAEYEKSTLKTILKNGIVAPKIRVIIDQIRATIGGEINDKWLDGSWNSVVKEDNYDISNQEQTDQLIINVVKSYRRSKVAGDAKAARSKEGHVIAASLHAVDAELNPIAGGREQLIAHNHLHELNAPEDSSPAVRMATHVSSMVLAQHPLGVEVQGAMQHDGMGMMLSSNKNNVNDTISGQLKIASDLKNFAAQMLLEAGAEKMTKNEVMENRILRHAAKLYMNVSSIMASDAPITVPTKVEGSLDGLHAEIRIKLDRWTPATHKLPHGTRLPCMGCYMHFNGQKILLGKWMGPLWMSNAGMTMQIKELLLDNKKLGSMGAKHVKAVGQQIARDYKALPDDTRMAHSRKRDGTYTIGHDPDSGSDMEDDVFADFQNRLKARRSKAPMSPVWHSMEDWSPSQAASSSNHSHHHHDPIAEQELPVAAIQDTLPLGVNEVGLGGAGAIKIRKNQLPLGFVPEEGVIIYVNGERKKVHYISEFNGKLTMDYVPA